jgi:succinate dehydrogenase flavin-adding protein (antitoxin of CptAB toxin-antitoxin module)
MLELDLLLEQFLLTYGPQLSDAEQETLSALLSASDQELLAWLLYQEAVPEAKFIPLLAKIREYTPCNSL